jgi:hypothetical protein
VACDVVVAAHVAEHQHDQKDQESDAINGGIDEHAALTPPRKSGEWVGGDGDWMIHPHQFPVLSYQFKKIRARPTLNW